MERDTETQGSYTAAHIVGKCQSLYSNSYVIQGPMPITLTLQGLKGHTQVTFQFHQTLPPTAVSPVSKRKLTLLKQGIVRARQPLLVRSPVGCTFSPESEGEVDRERRVIPTTCHFGQEAFCTRALLGAYPQLVRGGSGIQIRHILLY